VSLRSLGASVRGPAHARLGEPNQDAWCARIGPTGALAVVADGMGSRALARQGARAAVAACTSAWRHWTASPRGTGEDLVRLIEVLWRMRLGHTPMTDAATTCVVCALRADGGGVFVQLGDGLAGIRDAHGSFRSLTPERTTFGSVTRSLGTPHGLRDWTIESLDPVEPGSALLIATDGVADDLLPESRAGFVEWLICDVAAKPSPQRALGRVLRDWPVPKHLDDKTLVLLWEPSR
jgi:serine/threonine protein phosphatase PrpC